MPASKSGVLSEDEMEQRAQAARNHGIYLKTMTPEKARTIFTFQDQLSTQMISNKI